MYATFILIALNILAFILQSSIPGFTDAFVLEQSDVASRPWILLTSMFLHGSLVHIMSNLFGLFLFGLILEKEIGSKRFILVYLITGLFAAFAASLMYPSSLGASGAIFGVMGALAIMQPGMTVWVYGMPVPMIIAIFIWAAVDFLGLLVPSNIANAAHLGGLFLGVVFGIMFRLSLPRTKHTNRGLGDRENRELDNYERRYGLR